ncbi:hypothetical protein [Mycolicibacterium hodleri]|uniref:Uncharacterized protein n=1 Tax=Mycolicibacterium hodleri TaxID=49897 RepID=A0A502EDX0_9MYCO|nr:hypothetical protein [Mycolicibacterium hodleri]TPG34696.1 hypothetical protein EAH80_12720 [Mycolicibacterium hodleri]
MSGFDEVAFGEHPGRWPLPAAGSPMELWLRAVAAGGQGRYGSAMTDLDSLARSQSCRAVASLALSTRASFVRQLGGHRAARAWDGRAWALAGSDVPAAADALIGLAADALGVRRFALSGRLLDRAADLLAGDTTVTAPGRLPMRLAWVRAELAMFIGDGTAAVEHAEGAVDLASRWTSARHVTKSQVVLAAALCSVGDLPVSRRIADGALQTSERHGLVPLSWALACLLVDIGSAEHSPSRIAAVRDRLADVVRHRGGTWTAR